MDAYFGQYFGSFLHDRPYASLIFSTSGTVRFFSGRVWFREHLYDVDQVMIAGAEVQRPSQDKPVPSGLRTRTSRAASLYGVEALQRLWRSTVTVVGVGGTGSAAAHVLARAGVGRVVLIDTEVLEPSNIERLHGSEAAHLADPPTKVDIIRDMCRRVNPDIEVVAIDGNCLQPLAIDWMSRSDLVLGCTDTMHSRVGLSELAYRYLVPVIDIGVQLDGSGGAVTAQCIQFVVYQPGLPCAYCRNLVDTWRLTAELMPESEREARRGQAREARDHDRVGEMYWRELPQLLTVGHLTTTAGAMGAGYAIGLLTATSRMPATFFQVDLLSDGLGYVAVEVERRPECACAEIVGYGDLGNDRAAIAAPAHWREARIR